MKFTLSWLKQYLDTKADIGIDQIAEKLTAIGLEVESVENPAEQFDGFLVGHVVKAEKHPDADRLRVCQVDVGDGNLRNIVCGAPNARAGIKIAFAPIGAYIPGIDVTLKKAEIRGVPSEGMMCSERELCLSDEHEGIIELPAEAKIGSPLAQSLGIDDPIFDVALTPNRGDCAGVYGIARDLAAAGLGTLKAIEAKPVKGAFDNPIAVEIKDHKACPLFLGRLIRNVKNQPSPPWLQQRLKAVGLRPISALVDITNYFSIGLCRPLHVFDADRLKGAIQVRMAKKGEKLAALNEKTYDLDEGMIAICDDSGVLGLGGIMGGVSSACEADTVNVYVECAYFDPLTIARTGQKLQINSDARYRFERGVDTAFASDAMELATQMILDLCGGEASTVIVAGSAPDIRQKIAFDPSLTERLTGVELPTERQIEILEQLGFKAEKKGKIYEITTPSWRHDIQGAADFVEEIIRIHGFDNIPALSVTREKTAENSADLRPALPPEKRLEQSGRRLLAGRGLHECVTWSFVPSEKATLFADIDDSLRLANPISSDMDVMRPSILPNFLKAAIDNANRGCDDGGFFEIGPVFFNAELVKGQETVATGLRFGAAVGRHWTNNSDAANIKQAIGATPQRPVDVMDAKADILALLTHYAPNIQPQLTQDAPRYFHPGKAGTLRLGKVVLGVFGEIHPAVLAAYDIDFPVVAFELFTARIPGIQKPRNAAKPLLTLNPLQPLTRDFAFIVADDVRADDVLRAVLMADKAMLADAALFDVYQGKGVEDGHKSLAISVTIQPQDKTLADEDIEAISAKIIKQVADKVGGKIRA